MAIQNYELTTVSTHGEVTVKDYLTTNDDQIKDAVKELSEDPDIRDVSAVKK